MGSAPSTTSTRVNSIKAHREKVCTDRDQKLGELEGRVSDLERELNRSQQLCLQVEAQKSQATDELGMLREELERLNKELADSRASSASERATQQVSNWSGNYEHLMSLHTLWVILWGCAGKGVAGLSYTHHCAL